VVVGIEIDPGLLVGSLVAVTTRFMPLIRWPRAAIETAMRPPAKSDRSEARVLADLVCTDRHKTDCWLETPTSPRQYRFLQELIRVWSGRDRPNFNQLRTRGVSSTLAP
jgi:hypothetical protein